ncbi:DUF2493 domain-containing protein [Hyphomicrobium sp. DY-1]|jgi:hypothetical protein|uniref:DUF2493 domain-containing protein n=1 Tax=Hyphomicrobium sp. DY-1 TaxID=3075650 RepID=UPI0039C140EE
MSHSPSRTGYPSSTATARVMDGLDLYGYTPGYNEPDPRPMPDAETLNAAAAALLAAIAEPFADTALEPDIEDLAWSLVDIIHRKVDRVQRFLHDNETRQRDAQEQQDGSEVMSVELESLIDKGRALTERRDAFEQMRDLAAAAFQDLTGSVWRPRTKSMVNHRTQTAALIDSKDFLSAKRYAETNVLIPPGELVLFSGGQDCNDIDGIFRDLDAIRANHPQMVLGHSANRRGADRIAESWAANRGVPVVAFRPMATSKDDKSAPFKRNDRMLQANPIGVIVYPGNGINYNLADKAKKLGIRLLDRTGRKKAD